MVRQGSPQKTAPEKPEEEDAVEGADQDAASFLATIPEEHREAAEVADAQVAYGDESARLAQAQQLVQTREDRKKAREQTLTDLDAALETAPVAESTVYALPPEQYRAREIVKIRKAAAEAQLDATVPGGRYTMADGSVRNAAGELLEEASDEEE